MLGVSLNRVGLERVCVIWGEDVWMYALPVGMWINRYMDIHYAETKPNHLYLATSSKDYT